MATPKGTLFVLTLTLLPPTIFTLRTLLNPTYLPTASKSLLLLYLVLYVYIFRRLTVPYFTSPLRYLPQPGGGSFLLGQAYAVQSVKPVGETYRRWMDSINNSGLIYFRNFFHAFPVVLLTTPEALQEVLVTHAYDYVKPLPGRMLLSRTTGNGLIVVEGAEHKSQRKRVQPAFSGKHIKQLVPLFWSKSQQFAQAVAEQLDDVSGDHEKGGRTGVIEIGTWASRVTLDIIGLACVGQDFNSLYNSDNEFVKQYSSILKGRGGSLALLSFTILSALLPLHIARWTPFMTRFRQASEARYQLRPLCRKLIEVKRKELETESEKHIDILSVLMRPGELSDNELVDQLLTFLAAGHETTAGALTWTTHLLALNPYVQRTLRAELLSHFPSSSPIPATLDSTILESLPYLHAVTSEQLRFMPTVPNTMRLAIRDTTVLGQHIPAGTTVSICVWAINRSKAIWGPDANEFRPERWLGSDKAALGGANGGPLSLITFLHGPRSCIGQAFSRAELKCLIAALVMRFEIEMADPKEVVVAEALVTMKPKNGMRLRLREL